MRHTTLCFLIKDHEVLLAMKKRGFGMGKWNGVGGKVMPGETVEQAAVREEKEEIGVTTAPDDLRQMGVLHFSFEGKPDWDQDCSVFVAERWEGEPSESEEMKPAWYAKDTIPYDAMWIDDPHWFPLLLAGKKFEGSFHFGGDGATIVTFEMKET